MIVGERVDLRVKNKKRNVQTEIIIFSFYSITFLLLVHINIQHAIIQESDVIVTSNMMIYLKLIFCLVFTIMRRF